MSDSKDEVEEIPSRDLPLSTVDNTPPLLLDLPDGQQLVVGKLPDGIVIEIATWRGTGRPDSRTNRMMLGVSYDEAEGDAEEKPRRAILKRVKREIEPVSDEKSSPEENFVEESIAIEQVTEEVVEPAIEEVIEPTTEEVAVPAIEEVAVPTIEEVIEPTTEHDAPTIEDSVELEIENLVDIEVPIFASSDSVATSRNMQDLFGARPRTEIEDQDRSPLTDRGHEIVSKKSKASRNSSNRGKSIVKSISGTLASVVAIYLVLVPAGISFTLPDGGLRTSLSSAANSVVVVKKSSEYVVGDSVVAAIQAPGNPNYFATIAAQSNTEFVLTENNLYHSTLRENVKGKVVLVMPGIGFILHKLGL